MLLYAGRHTVIHTPAPVVHTSSHTAQPDSWLLAHRVIDGRATVHRRVKASLILNLVHVVVMSLSCQRRPARLLWPRSQRPALKERAQASHSPMSHGARTRSGAIRLVSAELPAVVAAVAEALLGRWLVRRSCLHFDVFRLHTLALGALQDAVLDLLAGIVVV